MIRIRRAYDPPAEEDGDRVLVDRLWPRGVTREKARVASWARDIAPSTELRQWFGHDPARWDEFRKRYARELQDPAKRAALRDMADRSRRVTVTLVFGAKDELHNNAVVLKRLIEAIARKAA